MLAPSVGVVRTLEAAMVVTGMAQIGLTRAQVLQPDLAVLEWTHTTALISSTAGGGRRSPPALPPERRDSRPAAGAWPAAARTALRSGATRAAAPGAHPRWARAPCSALRSRR